MSDSEQMTKAKNKAARRTQWISLVLVIIIIALFTMIHTSKTAPLAFRWEGDQLTVSEPDGKMTSFQLATATDITWAENWAKK